MEGAIGKSAEPPLPRIYLSSTWRLFPHMYPVCSVDQRPCKPLATSLSCPLIDKSSLYRCDLERRSLNALKSERLLVHA